MVHQFMVRTRSYNNVVPYISSVGWKFSIYFHLSGEIVVQTKPQHTRTHTHTHTMERNAMERPFHADGPLEPSGGFNHFS